jgi:hypothetical protein
MNKLFLIFFLLLIFAASEFSILLTDSGIVIADRGFMGSGPLLKDCRNIVPVSVISEIRNSGRPFFREYEKWAVKQCSETRSQFSLALKKAVIEKKAEMTVEIGAARDVMRNLGIAIPSKPCPSGGIFFFQGPESWEVTCTIHRKGK